MSYINQIKFIFALHVKDTIKYVFYKKAEIKKDSNFMIDLLTLESFIRVFESASIDLFFGVMMHFY